MKVVLKTRATGAMAAAFCAAMLASSANAQNFPSQPLEFVAHTAAGGGTDQFARLVADIMVKDKIVSQVPQISNRVGGGGAIAYSYVKSKKGDPHVILAVATGTFLSALTRPDLGFSVDDFTPLAFFAMDPQIVAVNADTKFNNVKDLIEAAKKEPNTIVSAIASATGSGRLFQYLLEKQTGAKFKYVSFKSGSEAGTAVAGGHIQVTTENLSEVAPFLESKKVRILAVTGERRMAALPSVPTMREAGFPLVVGTGRAFAMPAGVSKEAAAAGEALLKRAFGSKIWKDYSTTNNFEDTYMDSAQFRKYIESRRDEFKEFLSHVGLLKP